MLIMFLKAIPLNRSLVLNKEEEKVKAEWYDLMLLSLSNYISQGTVVQFLSSFSRALLHVEVWH